MGFSPLNTCYVYILTNRSGTPYVGMTNSLFRRMQEHRDPKPGSFSSRYKTNRLVFFEETNDVITAIEREKQLNGWLRKREIELIAETNPTWRDLSEDWIDPRESAILQQEGASHA